MDNRFYDNVIGEMTSFFEQNGFKPYGDEFVSDTKKVKVEYSEDRQMYLLRLADIVDGTETDYEEAEAWLFDDSQNAKDATSVGKEFTSTLREKLGIKIKRVMDIEDVALPTANKNGAVNMTGFTKRVLDIFPAYKNDYKEHVALYGNLLYLDFFANSLVVEGKSILLLNERKSVKKLYELLEDMFVKGDRETVNAVVAVSAAMVYNNETAKKNLFAVMEDNRHFYDAVKNFLPVFSKNKKLVAIFKK